jgi:CheY-like chemotaxis protein
MGVLESEADGVPSSEADIPSSPQTESVEPVVAASGVLGEELELLNRALAGEGASQRAIGVLHSVLSEKRTAVIAFEGSELEALLGLLEFQRSIPVTLSHGEAALTPAPWQSCDLVMVNTPREWAVTEPIDPGYLLRINKPTIVFGPKDVLMRLGGVMRTDTRDFIPAPWAPDDIAWRAAMLLSRAPETPPHAGPPADATKPVVVIAEDDTTTRALLSTMLSRYGMHCHPTDNGAAALQLVRSLHPHAAILDVSMPCLDGFQVLASIKQDPSLASTKVVLLTSRQTEVDVLQAFGLGADDYMTKPFSPMELAARLKRLLVRNT